MANVKMSLIGLMDMLYFKNKKKEREKVIQSTVAKPLVEDYSVNVKAMERHPAEQHFVIEKITTRGDDVCTYTLKKKDGTNPAFFRAGQYVVIRQVIDGKLIARPVSISSGPELALDGRYELTVKRVPDGFMSQYILENWKIGDEITTSGPHGTFYYEGFRDAKKVIAVAGGSGITPILSMASAIASGDEDFEMIVLYGSRSTKDMLFKTEFDEISEKTSKVKLVNVFSEETVEGQEHGFIGAELITKYARELTGKLELGMGDFSIFAAGPQAMYKFLDAEVAKLPVNEKFYRKELFGAAKQPWTLPGYKMEAKDKTFNVHVKMCNKEYDIPCSANETILTAFERAGIAGPNRCRGGVCGWCRSRLISGEVFIPEDTDGRRAADKVYGYIHPCASFALSDLSIDVPNK